MLKMSEANIAVVAKKASDIALVVTMIDVKITATSRLVRFANGASAILIGKHFVVSPKRDAIGIFKTVISTAARVVLAPLTAVGRSLVQICQSPFFMPNFSTRLANLVFAVEGPITGEKLIQRLGFLARLAPLHAFRRLMTRRTHSVGLLPSDLARLAIGVQSISLRSVLVEVRLWLLAIAGFAQLHLTLPCEGHAVALPRTN